MRRTVAAVLMLMLLAGVLPLSTALAATDISAVRVRLTTNNATSIVMSVKGEYFINENGRSFSGGSLTLRAADGIITVTHSTQGELFSGKNFSIKRAKMVPSAGSMYFNSRNYLGHFNVQLLSTGYIQVVNEVPLAHYLYGVVAYEMNNNYPIEALKAQAVAAKSYMLTAVLASPNAQYHMGDTSSDQVYKGYNSAYTNVINAVDSTIDKVLAVNGNILCTYYSASNGGETNLVSYAWPTRATTNAGYAINLDPHDIANPASLGETLKIPIGSTGTISQGLYNLLLAKAYAATGTQPTGISLIKSADVHTPKHTGTLRNMSMVTIVMDVTTDGGNYNDLSVTFNVADLYTYGAVANANLRCYWGEYNSDGSSYYIYHVRWGHGVGLSQRGAQQRASSAQSYSDILAFYYPGATLSSVEVGTVADPVRPSTVVGMTPIGAGKTTAEVNLRTGPSTNHTSLGMVARNAALTVYELVDGWYHVALDGTSSEGWVYASYVKYTAAVTPSPTPVNSTTPTNSPGSTPAVVSYGVCTGEGVNFREGPGTNYKSIKKLGRNTQLSIITTSSLWYYALANGDYGYISASYVKITGDATVSPTPSPTPSATPTPTPGTSASPSPSPSQGGSTFVEIGIITAGGVNFRKGPDTSYQSLAKLDKNTGIVLLGRSGAWVKALIGSEEGYVHQDYVKVTGTALYTPGGNGGGEAQTPAKDYGEGATTGSVNLRVGPGVDYKALKVLSKGEKLKLYALQDGWYQVSTPEGTQGWVSAKYVSLTAAIPVKTEPPKTDPGTGENETSTGTGVTNTTVNFREGPGNSYKIITQFSKGVRVSLYGLSDGWYAAEYDGKRGYLYAKYVTAEAKGTEAGSQGGIVPEGSGNIVAGGLTLASGESSAKVNLRTKASTTGSSVLATLAAGTSFQVLGECGDWYYILYGGKTGFVYKPYARVTSSGTAGVPVVGDTLTLISTSTTAEVNLRQERGTSSAKIKLLSNKTPLTVYLMLEGWCLVNAGGVYGWVIDDYVKLA